MIEDNTKTHFKQKKKICHLFCFIFTI